MEGQALEFWCFSIFVAFRHRKEFKLNSKVVWSVAVNFLILTKKKFFLRKSNPLRSEEA